MAFKVLSYAKQNASKRQVQDILEVEAAIIMMGQRRFAATYFLIFSLRIDSNRTFLP